ncbi:hypothetical protein AOQ84DRAFT_321579 [Glonium stellatum]|uniref:Rhodopsin domain-containing protein n=1 Tax=Glonium stellatum TaxID=574774 RepID=A0A8E2EWU5_9PEZI|nr:hypothetical protein AOQ84DRAFT_321579 [Glonium stellatum]
MASIPPGTDLSKIPLAANPSGAPPNFINPPSLAPAVQGVGIALGIVSICLVVVRVRAHSKLNRGVGVDDLCCVLALLLAISYTGVVSSTGKLARHSWDIPVSFLDAPYIKKIFVMSLFYGPMLFLAKAAILLLYLRAFQPKMWLRVGVYITLAILFCSYFMTVPLVFVYCMPHNGRAWDINVLSNCDHLETPGLVQGAINIAADVTIFILPLPIIFRLHMPTNKKIAVASMFATGLFALIASVLTMYYRTLNVRGIDPSWTGVETYICVQAEVYVAICVSCMPSLARFWKTTVVETKLYGSLQSLFHPMKSSQGSIRSGHPNSSSPRQKSSGSSSDLRKGQHYELGKREAAHSFSTIETYAEPESREDGGIMKKVTTDVSSQAATEEEEAKCALGFNAV